MHLDDQIISSYLDNEVSSPWKEQFEEHVQWCQSCQARLEEARHLKTVIDNAVLPQKNIEASQTRVLNYIEKNTLKKKKPLFKAILSNLGLKKIIWPAFAAAVTFCFCLIVFAPFKGSEAIQNPLTIPSLAIENIIPVRASDNYTTGKSLSDYSLEDIMQYLDKEGYDISISPKAIQPITVEEPEIGSTKIFLGTGPNAFLLNQQEFELFKTKLAFKFQY